MQIARLPDRPTTLDYIQYLFTDFLSATETEHTEMMRRLSAESPNITACRSPSSDISAEKTRKKTLSAISMPHPEGYRKALRLMKQADKFNRPIICFIDTKGAYLQSGGGTGTK